MTISFWNILENSLFRWRIWYNSINNIDSIDSIDDEIGEVCIGFWWKRLCSEVVAIQKGYNEILGRCGTLFCSALQLSRALSPLLLWLFSLLLLIFMQLCNDLPLGLLLSTFDSTIFTISLINMVTEFVMTISNLHFYYLIWTLLCIYLVWCD